MKTTRILVNHFPPSFPQNGLGNNTGCTAEGGTNIGRRSAPNP